VLQRGFSESQKTGTGKLLEEDGRKIEQDNRKLHFARAVYSRHPRWRKWSVLQRRDFACCDRVTIYCQWGRHPFPAIGDAAYRQCAGEGLSHGHRQHAQKFCKNRAWGSGDILSDTQTDRQTYSSQYLATALAGE